MKTYPMVESDSGRVLGFEVDSDYASVRAITRLLEQVQGVSHIEKRPLFANWAGVHVKFRFRGTDAVVYEPYGDNSRLIIGQTNKGESAEFSDIERVFSAYTPPWPRRVFARLLSWLFFWS